MKKQRRFIKGNEIAIPTGLVDQCLNGLYVGDELFDPRNFSDVEIEEWKEKWGQSQSEITAELGYPKSHSKSDELLVDDYFWIEEDKKWYPKSASMYTPREQAIANYLRLS